MSINWSFESYLDPQINEEITFHSLEHGVRGYKFKNAPENYGAALHEDWNDIMRTGSKIHGLWNSMNEERILSCYIMAPFHGRYIFIRPKFKYSGGRKAIDLDSKICNNPEFLVLTILEEEEKLSIPSLESLGIEKLNTSNKIKFSSDNRYWEGLSSWLFQSENKRKKCGVFCGISLETAEKLFPNTKYWIEESTEDIRVFIDSKDSLQSLVDMFSDPMNALSTKEGLELMAKSIGIDFDLLIRVFVKDKLNGDLEIEPRQELMTRLKLEDRDGALIILDGNKYLIKEWMEKNSHTAQRHGEELPFSKKEISAFLPDSSGTDLTEDEKDENFIMIKESLNLMNDYPFHSKIKMASNATRIGPEDDILLIWEKIGRIGVEGLKIIIDDVFHWSHNTKISDILSVLSVVEGKLSEGSLVTRREIVEQLLKNKNLSLDIEGICIYLPDYLASEEFYSIDNRIAELLEIPLEKSILRSNLVEDKNQIIQKRVILYVRKSLPSGISWSISDIVGDNRREIIENHKMILPILIEFMKKKKVYPEIKKPRDGFSWVSGMTPKQFLGSLENPKMENLMKKITTKSSTLGGGWINPKAVSKEELPVGWERKKKLAELIVRPKIKERLRFYNPVILLIISSVIFIGASLMTLATYRISISCGMSTLESSIMTASSLIPLIFFFITERLELRFSENKLYYSISLLSAITVFIYLSYISDLSPFNELKLENIDYYLFTIKSPNSPLITFFSAMVLWLSILKLLKKSRKNKEENKKLISIMKSGGE